MIIVLIHTGEFSIFSFMIVLQYQNYQCQYFKLRFEIENICIYLYILYE